MECYYYKGTEKFSNPSKVVEAFLRSKSKLDPSSSIFSSLEVQRDTIDKINELHNEVDFESEAYMPDLKFISKPNMGLFKNDPELKNIIRLTPEYIEANRMPNYIIEVLNEIKAGRQYEVEEGIFVNDAKLQEVLRNPIINNANIDTVKTILRDYENILETEEGTKDISRIIKRGVIRNLKGKGPYTNLSDFFDGLYENKESSTLKVFGENTPENIANWTNKINEVSAKIAQRIQDKGETLTELKLVSTPIDSTNKKIPKVSSRLDLVAVDSSGNAHIFEIKTSKKSFQNWDGPKVLTNDWALAIKRQILGQSIDIDKIKLYIIPVVMDNFGSHEFLRLQDTEVRTNDQTAELRKGGRIAVMADKILPRKIFPMYKLERAEKLKETLKLVIDEKYEVRTEDEDTNVDKIVQSAERAFKRNGEAFVHYNPHITGIPDIPKGHLRVEAKSSSPEDVSVAKAEFTKLIEKYVAFVKEQDNRGVAILYDQINQALTSGESLKSGKHQERLRHILYEYLNDDWETIEIKEGVPMGMIVLRNKVNGTINLFSLSVDQFKAPIDPGEFTNKNLDGYTYKDLDVIKAMVFLNEFRNDLLPNNAFKIGQLITFNPKNGDSSYTPMTDALELYNNHMFKKGLKNDVKIKDSDLLGIEDIALNDFFSVIDNYQGSEKEKLEGISNMLKGGHISDISEQRLKDTLEALYKEFPEYVGKTMDTKLNFSDPVEVIIALLQTAILTKSDIELHGDFTDLTKYSFQFADFKSLITSLYKKNQEVYDKFGNKIQGLFQGLVWASPEHIQSRDIRQINEMISIGNSEIGQQFLRVSENIRVETKKYYEHIEYGMINRLVVGETQSKHMDFYLPGKQYVTKNPYVLSPENNLSKEASDYLKYALFTINKYMVGLSDAEAAALDYNSLESLETNEEFAKLLASGEYFEMPLMRRDEMSKYNGMWKSADGKTKNASNMAKDYMMSWIDSRELSKHDLINIRSQSKGFFHMYDPYGNQRGSIRAKMLQERSADYYEMNLDTIMHKVAFTKIRKRNFDLILPTINAYIWWIKLAGARTSSTEDLKDIEKTIEYVVNQVKLAVLDGHLIGDEEAVLAKGASLAKQISTISMLSFRPILTAKEMTIGVLKNFSAAGIGLDPEYNMKDMTKAYQKLITIDNKFTDEFNLIDRLNGEYRIANMDISSIPKKFQTDRFGVAKGLGHYMFATSTIGDYYNRLAMFLAKMIHEGSYDAHSLDENQKLIYDPKKDKRFSRYLAERHNHVDADGNFIAKNGDEEYNTQRRRYLWTIGQMNTEGKLTKKDQLTEHDLITKAYSHKERNSIKAQTDLMYGAYDKDAQAHINNTLFGIAFMQFLTYWPNKVKFYFGKKIDGKDSPIGQAKQATQTDDKGVKHKLWYKTVVDEKGIEQLEWTTENTGDPVFEFTGTPQEGTFIAAMGILQDTVRMDWSKIKNDSLRNRRAVFGLVDAGLLFLVLGMMRELWKWLFGLDDRGKVDASKNAAVQAGVLGEVMYTVNNKVFREYNVWENTFGAISTEPLWLNWTQRTFKDLRDTLTGQKDLTQLAAKSIGALEMMRE